VKAPTQYGRGVLALSTLLNTSYLMPFKKIRGLFADIFGVAINESTLVTANTLSYDALAASEAVIHAQKQASPVCHFDETGIRVAGHLSWYHVAVTPTLTSAFVHPKRGTQALTSPNSLFPTYAGWAVHDCWTSDFASTSCRHALCGAHLLRELTAVAEQGRQWASQMQILLRLLYRRSAAGTQTVPDPQRWSRVYDTLCQHAHREEPPLRRAHRKGKATRTTGRNLVERLIKYTSAVLAFALHQEVPFTNNQAERDVRPVKVKQKIAGCFRTLRGAQHYARIASFISTARKQHCQVFNELRPLFLGHSFLLVPVCAK